MKDKNLKTINNYIFDSLERLEELELETPGGINRAEAEIKRSNAITSASKVILNSVKIENEIIKLKHKDLDDYKELNEKIGFDE